MNSFKNMLTPHQEQKFRTLGSWHRALENCALRMECPDAYHEELLRLADEMDRQRMISWQEWRDLRLEADQAYLRAVAGEDYHPGT
ncbi:hypothetical protein [Pseudomonas sp. TNT3]|jgi:hypothetical protein|uniref:hypothetical protein n=1 Tax=Pseudomonas sp. TNT3 TaxID=2654097 RepID=UPI001391574B|nr:hypothetical protein [Pseudomonas sp. TNT3]KAI2684370.1 hypothetical protein GBC55_014605 [Pseudomonas sp. TNT3]MBH1968149.1 hypothetical protein [Pseudomonadales bacterium]MBH2032685.1 hypothetical protein [Pseudomonadales bacterium]MBH2078143.1 hypothetical protein [Pseudomonadales bacterium]